MSTGPEHQHDGTAYPLAFYKFLSRLNIQIINDRCGVYHYSYVAVPWDSPQSEVLKHLQKNTINKLTMNSVNCTSSLHNSYQRLICLHERGNLPIHQCKVSWNLQTQCKTQEIWTWPLALKINTMISSYIFINEGTLRVNHMEPLSTSEYWLNIYIETLIMKGVDAGDPLDIEIYHSTQR